MHTVNHNKNIIEVRDISFSRGNDVVLHDISFAIHRGDYLGIVGGNGAGKTTLLKIILGLLKPDAGEVRLFGTDINDFKEWHRIGYVPQQVTNFDPNFPATVFEVVLMGRYGRRGMFNAITDEDRTKAQQALGRVDMWHAKDRLIGDLSGGQQQRVFIARALTGEPEVVFLDEPTVGVSEDVKKEFYALLRTMNEDLDLTVVLVTHDLESMTEQAMHVACISGHTLSFHDCIDESFREEHHDLEHLHTHI
jgi:zinc transport system ATP-binding protein